MTTVVANTLKQLRETKRFSQTYVASQLKISSSTLSNYESGNRRPDLEKLKVFADFYNVPIDYLYGLGNSKFLFLGGEERQKYEEFRKAVEEKPDTFKAALYFVSKMPHKELNELMKEIAI